MKLTFLLNFGKGSRIKFLLYKRKGNPCFNNLPAPAIQLFFR